MREQTNELETIANQIYDLHENIILIYAFNSVGKTRLSVEYKNLTKSKNNHNHIGLYYNAYSEDLFHWDNDNLTLNIIESTLNEYHTLITEDKVHEKLEMYNLRFDFIFNPHKNTEKGIESVSFFVLDDKQNKINIKISRSEQQLFIWCFFLTLFDVEGLSDIQNKHFFIDDPVSSLDDNNIFITSFSLKSLIDKYFKERKIIITTHHIGFFSILSDFLSKGNKSSRYKDNVKHFILADDSGNVKLKSHNKDVFLYHLKLLQTIDNAIETDELFTYHFAILRQALETISSFLGKGSFSYVLEQIGMSNPNGVADRINSLSHNSAFRFEPVHIAIDNKKLIRDVFSKIKDKYGFKLNN